MMRRFVLLALALMARQHADAFVPASFQTAATTTCTPIAQPLFMASDDDVSVPYDAAARLAYDQWRAQFGKGAFDDARYSSFKSNYQAITVANIKAKTAAKQSGQELPMMLTLNEFGDFTAAEYNAFMSAPAEPEPEAEPEAEPEPSSSVMSKAMEAAQLSEAAGSALSEAADALAEEEQKLAEQLGLDSVEELEEVLDAMEGIDEEGVQDNLAREARVRSAYLQWCKDTGKEADESRYPTFEKNFLTMEKFAQQNNKPMKLNKYADCTEEEYMAAMDGEPAPAPSKSSVDELMEEAETGDVAGDADVMAALKAVAEAEDAAKAATAAPKVSPAQATADKNAQARLEQMEQKRKEAEERKAFEAMSQEEQRKKNEAERKARQTEQDKTAEAARKAAEASAIAATKKEAEKEAQQIAKRRQFELEAAEIARAQARDWEEKQAALLARNAPPSPPPPPKPKAVKSLFQAIAQKPAPAPKASNSFFGSPKPSPKAAPKPKPAPKAAPKPAPKKPVAKSAPLNFFGSPAPNPAPPAAAPAKKAAPEPFSFFAPKPKPAPPAKKVAPAPKPAPMSFFGSAPKPAPAPKVAPPAPKPAPMSFFGSAPKPAPAPKVAPPAPTPAPFSFFGTPKAAPAPAPAPPPAPKPFSFFGGSPAPAPSSKTLSIKKAAPKKVAKKAPARSGTISIKPAAKKDEAKGGFSFFGGGKTAPANDGVPVLSKFVQNKDGSLTGFVSNAKGFRNGTKITTSPVRRGVKTGQVVTTGSGSKYRLQ